MDWKKFILDNHKDQYGAMIFGGNNGNGGDSLYQTSLFYIICYRLGLISATDLLSYHGFLCATKMKDRDGKPIKGFYTRHPREPWHGGNWDDPDRWTISRDNVLDFWIASGFIKNMKPKDDMSKVWMEKIDQHLEDSWSWVKSNWFRITKDIIGPHHFGVIFRAMKKWYHYPLVWLTDIALLINGIIIMIKDRNPNDTGRKLHHFTFLLQAEETWPTLFSWLSKVLWKKYVTMQYTFDYYYVPPNIHPQYPDGNIPLGELVRPILVQDNWGTERYKDCWHNHPEYWSN